MYKDLKNTLQDAYFISAKMLLVATNPSLLITFQHIGYLECLLLLSLKTQILTQSYKPVIIKINVEKAGLVMICIVDL